MVVLYHRPDTSDQTLSARFLVLLAHMALDHPTAEPDFDVRLTSPPTYWSCEPGWEWKARPLSDYLLWWVMDGAGSMRLGNRVWDLTAGSSFVFAPGEKPHGRQDPSRRLVVYGMHFAVVDGRGERVALRAEIAPSQGHVIRDTAFFSALSRRCDTSFRRGDACGVVQSRLYLKAMVLHVWEESLCPAPSAVDQALDDIVRTLQQEPSRRWTVDALAQRAYLSRAQFTRRFHAVTGQPPARYMIHARLERARQLMQDTTMTVEQIADALGYTDVAFFSRQCKRYLGHPPSAFRQQPEVGGRSAAPSDGSPESIVGL